MVPAPKKRMFLPKLVFAVRKSWFGLGHSVQPRKVRRLQFCGKAMLVTLVGKDVSKDLCRLYQSY